MEINPIKGRRGAISDVFVLLAALAVIVGILLLLGPVLALICCVAGLLLQFLPVLLVGGLAYWILGRM